MGRPDLPDQRHLRAELAQASADIGCTPTPSARRQALRRTLDESPRPGYRPRHERQEAAADEAPVRDPARTPNGRRWPRHRTGRTIRGVQTKPPAEVAGGPAGRIGRVSVGRIVSSIDLYRQARKAASLGDRGEPGPGAGQAPRRALRPLAGAGLRRGPLAGRRGALRGPAGGPARRPAAGRPRASLRPRPVRGRGRLGRGRAPDPPGPGDRAARRSPADRGRARYAPARSYGRSAIAARRVGRCRVQGSATAWDRRDAWSPVRPGDGPARALGSSSPAVGRTVGPASGRRAAWSWPRASSGSAGPCSGGTSRT